MKTEKIEVTEYIITKMDGKKAVEGGGQYAEVGFIYETNGEAISVIAESSGRNQKSFTAEWGQDGLRDQKSLTVTPYWVTQDGTVVCGAVQNYNLRK